MIRKLLLLAVALLSNTQGPVLNRLCEVLAFELGIAFQVGDGAGYFQDAIVGAGAQALLLHGTLQQALAVCLTKTFRPLRNIILA